MKLNDQLKRVEEDYDKEFTQQLLTMFIRSVADHNGPVGSSGFIVQNKTIKSFITSQIRKTIEEALRSVVPDPKTEHDYTEWYSIVRPRMIDEINQNIKKYLE